jgi:tetratricopeptide (TPR) repeat protein
MAAVHQRLGNAVAATAHYERALAMTELTLGPSHPAVAQSHRKLGRALQVRRKLTAAVEQHSAALEILETALGPDHERVGIELLDLAGALVELGRPETAVRHLQRALPILRVAYPENHPTIAAVMFGLGRAHEQAGRNDMALARMRLALAINEATLGPAHVEVGLNRCAIGRVQIDLGQTGPALTELELCLAILDATLGPTSPRRAAALIPLAELRIATDAPQLAIAPLEAAIDTWQRRAEPVIRARADFVLAKLLWEADQDRERAIDLAEDARFALSKAGEGLDDEQARIGDWLAGRDGTP